MKHLFSIALLGAGLFALSACNEDPAASTTATKDTTATASAPAPAAAPEMDSAAKMKAWMDYMTPGEPHKMLASWDGKWKTESTMWMEEGAPPATSTGVSTNTMIMGGRYQRLVHKSSMMGQPFEGEGIMGYDNAKKKYFSTWTDNMGTGIMMMEGDWDEASKTMTLQGSCKDPITGKETSMREVVKVLDDKNQTMEMYTTPAGGKEMKTMEMKMTRM